MDLICVILTMLNIVIIVSALSGKLEKFKDWWIDIIHPNKE
jgi:hypothetical protein